MCCRDTLPAHVTLLKPWCRGSDGYHQQCAALITKFSRLSTLRLSFLTCERGVNVKTRWEIKRYPSELAESC